MPRSALFALLGRRSMLTGMPAATPCPPSHLQAHGLLPGGDGDLQLRAITAFGLGVAVLFPLSFYRDIHKLAGVAALAMLSVMWIAGVVVADGAADLLSPAGSVAAESALARLRRADGGVEDWLRALPMIVYIHPSFSRSLSPLPLLARSSPPPQPPHALGDSWGPHNNNNNNNYNNNNNNKTATATVLPLELHGPIARGTGWGC